MIRTIKHKGKDYITVDTVFTVKNGSDEVSVPFHLQVNISKLEDKEYIIVVKKIKALFDHPISVNLYKPVDKLEVQTIKNEKSWWKKLFN